MGKMSCFAGLLGGKRTKAASKGNGKSKGAHAKKGSGNDCPKVKPVESMDMAEAVDVSGGGGDGAHALPACGSKFVAHAAANVARRGSDESRDKAAAVMTRSPGPADDLDAAAAGSSGYGSDGRTGTSPNKSGADEPDAGGGESPSPSVGRGWSLTASPKLKRSCSKIETTRSVLPRALDLPAKSRSYDDLKKALPAAGPGTGRSATPSGASPTAASFRTSCSADRVMLKKRSSRQVLPSRSRKLWWRLFLWSHRSLHSATMPAAAGRVGAAYHQRDGYTSDTLDAATSTDAKKKGVAVEELGPVPSQWVAFPADASSLDRVSAWVNSLGNVSFHGVDGEDDDVGIVTGRGHDDGGAGAARPQCSEIVELLPAAGGKRQQPPAKRRAADEAAQASGVVQTLNAFSSVAHISGMGLKAVPLIPAFSTLRTVNLSGNLIVQISPGSLPKGLHSLDLSRNKIGVIEGLRELTRLRVLNLSYNRISRIGHGLSSCTSIRELYVAGNKISDVEGLHRLLKLAVLDASFNKITTPKSLGQLVANYGSLRALNLLGNPVQANTGEDTLRKAVTGLLPRLEYLNKQAVKPQRAREVAKDSVAQAALGNGNGNGGGGWSSRRRLARRVSQSPGSSGKSPRGGRDGSSSRRGGSRSNSKTRRPQGSSSLARR